MNFQEFNQLKEGWEEIEQINYLEKKAQNGELQFLANVLPQCSQFRPVLKLGIVEMPDHAIALKPGINKILVEAMLQYRTAIEERMAALQITDSTAMPIE